MNIVLFICCVSKIFELCHIFKGFINYLFYTGLRTNVPYVLCIIKISNSTTGQNTYYILTQTKKLHIVKISMVMQLRNCLMHADAHIMEPLKYASVIV
jgi:hypothetical protein